MIAIASDHAGYELKEKIKQYLTQTGRAYHQYSHGMIHSVSSFPGPAPHTAVPSASLQLMFSGK